MQRPVRIGAALVALCVAGAAHGEGLKFASKNRVDLFDLQNHVVDTRAAAQYGNPEQALTDEADATASNATAGRSEYNSPYLDVARTAARRYGVPENMFLRLVQQESSWRTNVKSRRGAYGLTQLMPGTARALGVDRTDPAQNLDGGARYLSQLYDRFGSWPLALAAYNAGPTAVAKYKGVPPYGETRRYVRNIWGS